MQKQGCSGSGDVARRHPPRFGHFAGLQRDEFFFLPRPGPPSPCLRLPLLLLLLSLLIQSVAHRSTRLDV